MPVYQIDIQKAGIGQYLTNMYHVQTADFTAASAAAIQIALIEAAALPTFWKVTAARVSTPAPNDGQFITYPLNYDGSRSSSGDAMPLFNRFLIAFSAGNTYQCRKFFPGICEGEQTSGFVTEAARDQMQTLYITPLLALGVVSNPHGVLLISGVCKNIVAMRQLRRRKKRKNPVI